MIATVDDGGLELPSSLPVSRILRVSDDPATREALSEVNFFVMGQWWATAYAASLFPLMPKLEVIQSISVGVDRLLPSVPEGIVLCNASGVHEVGTAEWSVAMILAMTRGFAELRDAQNEERWQSGPGKESVSDRELYGSTVLILGYGSIGSAVERRLEPFGVEFIRVARTARPGVHGVEELDELLPQADVVLVALPATRETKGIVDEAFLARMRHGALLVNVARGDLADTDAVVRAAREGRIRAGLDVIAPTPLPPGHPAWSTPNLFMTPHVAAETPGAPARLTKFVCEQITRFAHGEPLLNVVQNGY